jgi:hypothetical protein
MSGEPRFVCSRLEYGFRSFGKTQCALALAHGTGVKAGLELAILSSCNQIGKLHELGIGTRTSVRDSLRCCRRAAALGNAFGQCNCGCCLSTGRACGQDKGT